ncbi:MAG: hypothetical protein J7L42_01845 [Elusimicrobia bacterium]|nr:hypothetical protein [Elusimicrobiota bacterium]
MKKDILMDNYCCLGCGCKGTIEELKEHIKQNCPMKGYSAESQKLFISKFDTVPAFWIGTDTEKIIKEWKEDGLALLCRNLGRIILLWKIGKLEYPQGPPMIFYIPQVNIFSGRPNFDPKDFSDCILF